MSIPWKPWRAYAAMHLWSSLATIDRRLHKASEKAAKELAGQLRNVGPKLAAKLIEAGIDTPEKLRRLGAKNAFDKMYPAGDAYSDYNAAYLYALEGAVRDCDWLDIPDKIKQAYKEYAQSLQSRKKIKRPGETPGLDSLAPQHGLEPRTQWLTAICSAD